MFVDNCQKKNPKLVVRETEFSLQIGLFVSWKKINPIIRLRLLSDILMLIGSAMFSATSNLVTRVGLP